MARTRIELNRRRIAPAEPTSSRKIPLLSQLAAAVALAAVAAVVFWKTRGTPNAPPSTPVQPALSQTPPTELPKIPFTNITETSGIHFVHVNGAEGEKLLPETMGSGCAFFDYDNDGNQDLLLINSCRWPWSRDQTSSRPTLKLYHNDGHGHFTDVTAGSGLDVSFYGMGVAVGDYDNDGLVDVFVTGVGENHLFKNLGHGKFRDVTAEAGLASHGEWTTSAAFIDYDNDGKLDLFVCNYVDWSRQKDVSQEFELPGVGRAYGPPLAFAGVDCRLFHNNGDGTFTDVSAAAGIQIHDPLTGRPVGKSLAVAPVDLDGDGWIDLIVANDTVQNFVFHNLRNGKFEEIGKASGIGFDSSGQARGAMGIDACYFRNDAALGVAVGNFAGEMNALYVSDDSRMAFHDDAMLSGIGLPTRNTLTFGLFFFDAGLNGRLDLFMANGHLEEQINRVEPAQTYRQPPLLLWNSPGARVNQFRQLTAAQCGPDLFHPLVARGAAYADIDNDGDLDLVITQNGGGALLFRNDQRLGNHWIRLKLIGNGTTCNRDAIGAWIEAQVAGQTLRRQVMPTRSYLSQVELPVTIGLGKANHVDRLQVIWPGGARQDLPAPHVDQTTVIRQLP